MKDVKFLMVSGLALAAPFAHADALDFTSITAGVSLAGIAAAIIAMGALKIVPNVAKWGTNKLVSFFR